MDSPNFYFQILSWKMFVFGPFLVLGLSRGKTTPKQSTICNFSKLAWYALKNGNTWTKCIFHHFGRCFARFLESALRFGHLKSHFLSLEKGHFWQKYGDFSQYIRAFQFPPSDVSVLNKCTYKYLVLVMLESSTSCSGVKECKTLKIMI